MKFKTIFAKMTMCSLMLTALFGCGQASQTADGAQDTQSAQTTELTVFAAASMTETLNQIAEDYKTVDPNVSLTFSFASSGDLLSQIKEGADCDVFISAAPKQMNALDGSLKDDADKNPDGLDELLDGTRIDFPVVQGADNMVYVNTDVYGAFSLSGAIFLDSRCPADFTAPYSIVYGHHIEDGGMFGDIVQFTQSDYFAAHTTGTLITDDTAYNIALFACVRADAYDPVLYDPAQSPDALLAYIKAHAVQYRTPGSGPVVAFSTCTEAATNGRVLLFGQLLPQT